MARLNLMVPDDIDAALYAAARRDGVRKPEFARSILRDWKRDHDRELSGAAADIQVPVPCGDNK